jgi:NADPH:quinone reductase-like Zn-dependent oxidoreductase
MHAAWFVGDQRIEIVEVPEPTPAPGEVLLKVAFLRPVRLRPSTIP